MYRKFTGVKAVRIRWILWIWGQIYIYILGLPRSNEKISVVVGGHKTWNKVINLLWYMNHSGMDFIGTAFRTLTCLDLRVNVRQIRVKD